MENNQYQYQPDNQGYAPQEQAYAPEQQPADYVIYDNGQPVAESPKKQTDVMGIISMVCAILGILMSCCCPYVAPILGIAAIVLAIISRSKNGGKFSVFAIIGLIVGILSIISMVLILVLAGFGGLMSAITEGTGMY